MWTRLGGILGVVLVATGVGSVGCVFTSGGSEGTENAVTAAKFDKNHLIDDDVLMDDRAVSVQKIQSFLDRTPYGTQSPLANYRDANGAPAAQLLHDAAVSYGVNPITLLVRIEMENGLVSAPEALAADDAGADDAGLETPTSTGIAKKIDNAFNCGRALGLEAQAGCATRSVARAMMLLESGKEAPGGWKRGAALKSKDSVTITPVNAATAAIYAYTPYVGEAGGGTKGVAGAAGHMVLWNQFAKALKYKGATCPADAGGCKDDAGATDSDSGAGIDVDAGDDDGGAIDLDAGSHDAATDAGSHVADAGTSSDAAAPPADAGKPPVKQDAAASDPNDDNPDDGAGHQTPADPSNGGTYGSFPTDPADDAGSSAPGSPKKGCSTTGGGTGDAGSTALLFGLAMLVRRRRAR